MLFYLLKTLFVIDVLIAGGLLLFRWALAPAQRGIVSAKIAGLALLTPAVALFCGNIYIFFAYLVVVVAFNSRSRAELAATYVFLLPSMPMLSVETGVGSIYLLAVSALLAMNVGALIGFTVTGARRSLTRARYDVAVLLLICIFVFAYNRDANFTTFLRGLTVNVLGFAGPYLLVSRGLGSREDIERLLLCFSLGAVVMAVTACYQAAKHWVLFETYYQALHVPFPITSFTLALRGGLLRTGGSMLDYSSAGVFLAAALTLTAMLRSRFSRPGFWGMVAVLIFGLVATQSRGGWVAAIFGILFFLSYRGLWGRLALLAGASIAAEAMILLFATSGRLAAIAGRTEEAGGTVTYRKQLLSQGLEQVRAHPLSGQSPDRLIASLPDLVQGQHIVDFVNAHLYVAMVAGVPLFLAWCGVWSMPVAAAWRRRQMPGADLIAAPAAIIVPVMVAIAATSIMDRNLTWPTIALALAGPCLTLSSQRRSSGNIRQSARLIDTTLYPPVLATSGV